MIYSMLWDPIHACIALTGSLYCPLLQKQSLSAPISTQEVFLFAPASLLLVSSAQGVLTDVLEEEPSITLVTKLTMAEAGCSTSQSAKRWHWLSVRLPGLRATNPKILLNKHKEKRGGGWWLKTSITQTTLGIKIFYKTTSSEKHNNIKRQALIPTHLQAQNILGIQILSSGNPW